MELPPPLYHQRPWLYELDLNALYKHFNLRPKRILGGGLSSLVILCEQDLVLKVLPSAEEAWYESQTLSTWPWKRTRPLDTFKQAMVLKFHPGKSLDQLAWDYELHQKVAHMCVRLHNSEPAKGLPLLSDIKQKRFATLAHRLEQSSDPMLSHHLDISKSLVLDLSDSNGLVHGDLTPANMLLTDAGDILPIDPKGYIGDKHYDFACWIVSSVPEGWRQRQLDAVHAFESAGIAIDSRRLAIWCYYMLVDGAISSHWHRDDHALVWKRALIASRP